MKSRRRRQRLKPTEQRRGFYLHACWTYNYPFAVRTWQREDYDNMFQLLKLFGYNTVMLFPATETIPSPISAADRKDLLKFREIIERRAESRVGDLAGDLRGDVKAGDRRQALDATEPHALHEHGAAGSPQGGRGVFEVSGGDHLDPQQCGRLRADRRRSGQLSRGEAERLRESPVERPPNDRPRRHASENPEGRPLDLGGWGLETNWTTDAKVREPFVMGCLEAIKQEQDKLEPWELLPGRHSNEGLRRRPDQFPVR